MKKKELKISCTCGGYHSLQITKWDDETELWIVMINPDNYLPFHKRIIEAVQYIFGREVTYHDVVLDKKDIKKLKKFIINL